MSDHPAQSRPTVSRPVAAPPEAVWAVLADGWQYGTWVVGASRVRAVDPGWPRAGARLHHSFGPWPAVISDATVSNEAEEPRHLFLTATELAGRGGSGRDRDRARGPGRLHRVDRRGRDHRPRAHRADAGAAGLGSCPATGRRYAGWRSSPRVGTASGSPVATADRSAASSSPRLAQHPRPGRADHGAPHHPERSSVPQGAHGGVPAAGAVHTAAGVGRGTGEVEAGDRSLRPPQTPGRPQHELLVQRGGAARSGRPGSGWRRRACEVARATAPDAPAGVAGTPARPARRPPPCARPGPTAPSSGPEPARQVRVGPGRLGALGRAGGVGRRHLPEEQERGRSASARPTRSAATSTSPSSSTPRCTVPARLAPRAPTTGSGESRAQLTLSVASSHSNRPQVVAAAVAGR